MEEPNVKPYKLAFSQISGDFEPLEFVTRSIASIINHVDKLFLTITYTTDEISEEAKLREKELKEFAEMARKGVDIEISFFKWTTNFSDARNFNFSRITSDYDWILWIDADDVFLNPDKIGACIELADKHGKNAVLFNYLYYVTFKEDGSIDQILIEHFRERLIKNTGWSKWVGSIHETIIGDAKVLISKDCEVLQYTNDEKMIRSMNRNIVSLEKELESQGNNRDPRTIFYLAKTYFDTRLKENMPKAERLIYDYLDGSDKNSKSGWDEERCQANQYLSEIYRMNQDYDKAISRLYKALEEFSLFPQTYIDLALMYCYKKDFRTASFYLKLSESVEMPLTTLVISPRDIKVRGLECAFNIAVNLNKIDDAYEVVMKLKEMFPNDEMINNRVDSMRSIKINNDGLIHLVKYARYLDSINETKLLAKLPVIIPKNLKSEPVIRSMISDITLPRVHDDNEISIFCGFAYEEWDGNSLKDGIGGSEEAVIRASRELVKLGYKVTVYANPTEDCEIDGVNYVSSHSFSLKDEFNILIVWRSVNLFDYNLKAKKKILWLHDVQSPLDYTEERVNKIDKILCLSDAHVETFVNEKNSSYLKDKILVTSNGIDVEEIEETEKSKKIKRNPHKIIYTSSYDRGLQHLLEMWSDIKKEVPEAMLYICYGWNTFDKMFNNNPERQAWKEHINGLMNQDGIVHLGRIGQDKIIEETLSSGIWAYPTHFYEINCITAIKCQAMGAIPVVCDYAALKQTSRYGIKINVDELDIYEPEIKDEYKSKLIELLKDTKTNCGVDRTEMMKWARDEYSWRKIVKEWDKEFKK